MGFEYAKQFLNKYEYIERRPLLKAFLGSMVGGVAISFAMTPFDLILVRLQNQRKYIFTNIVDFWNQSKYAI